jgi:hypothetical protein
MAEAGRPGEAPRGALADGAERFDRLARIVKESQLGRTKTDPGPPVTEAFELSPDDAWAKKYMTHCIGPVCFTVEAVAEPPAFAKFTAPPEASVQSGGFRAAGSKTAQNPPPHRRDTADRVNPGPIGLAIGKPVRARSWLGRLFGQ